MKVHKSKFKVVLFDLDGTLVYSEAMSERVLDELYAKYKDERISASLMSSFRGMPTREILAHIDSKRGPELLEECVELLDQYRMLSFIYPGIWDVLVKLDTAGIRLGVITSETHLELDGVRAYFPLDTVIDIWISADDVSQPKPHPESVWRAMELFDISSSETLFIGDSFYDIEAGKNAGVQVGAALWGQKDAQHIIDQNPDYAFRLPKDILNLCLG